MLNIALSRFKWLFQSTLSVRRATGGVKPQIVGMAYFNPRSP